MTWPELYLKLCTEALDRLICSHTSVCVSLSEEQLRNHFYIESPDAS